MNTRFDVFVSPQFERLARSLRRRHPDFQSALADVVAVLSKDPYGRAGVHAIRKLAGVGRAKDSFDCAFEDGDSDTTCTVEKCYSRTAG